MERILAALLLLAAACDTEQPESRDCWDIYTDMVDHCAADPTPTYDNPWQVDPTALCGHEYLLSQGFSPGFGQGVFPGDFGFHDPVVHAAWDTYVACDVDPSELAYPEEHVCEDTWPACAAGS